MKRRPNTKRVSIPAHATLYANEYLDAREKYCEAWRNAYQYPEHSDERRAALDGIDALDRAMSDAAAMIALVAAGPIAGRTCPMIPSEPDALTEAVAIPA